MTQSAAADGGVASQFDGEFRAIRHLREPILKLASEQLLGF
jgi:hypothetical protein